MSYKLEVYDAQGRLKSTSSGGGSTSFSDAEFSVYGDGDSTKKVALDVSGVSAGTTRTLTVADKGGTIALTSDLLADPVPIANGGTGQTTQTASFDALAPTTTKADIVVHNGSNNVRLAVGTNAQVLTANSLLTNGVYWADSPATMPYNFRRGFPLHTRSVGTIYVGSGSVSVEGGLYQPVTSTNLALATAGNWISGSADEAASIWINVYMGNSGEIKLHDSLPNYPYYATNSRVTFGQVNEAGWDGTAGQGLNATTIGLDNIDDDSELTAGRYILFYDDSGYTQGRGKGSGAGASVGYLSVARILAFSPGSPGTGDLDVEAGHNIAINDDDYFIVVEPGELLYRYESSVWWRWLGAIYNDSGSDLTDWTADFSEYTANEGSDYTTSSTTFTDVDSTMVVPLLATCECRVAVAFNGDCSGPQAGYIYFDVTEDGVALGGDDGITHRRFPNVAGVYDRPFGFVRKSPAPILPGTHDYHLQWKGSGGAMTLRAGAGTSYADVHPQFSAQIITPF